MRRYISTTIGLLLACSSAVLADPANYRSVYQAPITNNAEVQPSNRSMSVAPAHMANKAQANNEAPKPLVAPQNVKPVSHQQEVALQETPSKGDPFPLKKRSSSSPSRTELPFAGSSLNNTSGIVASLMVVIGLFLIFAWIGKKSMPKSMMRLPSEVVQVMGKAQLSGKQQLQLVRVGNRLILLSVTQHGAETLTEITDPVEVEKLLVHCKQEASGSMSVTFNQLLQDIGTKPTKGFLEA